MRRSVIRLDLSAGRLRCICVGVSGYAVCPFVWRPFLWPHRDGFLPLDGFVRFLVWKLGLSTTSAVFDRSGMNDRGRDRSSYVGGLGERNEH